MTPIGALIVECQKAFENEHGVPLSFADIARRGGDVMTRGRIQQIAREPIKAMASPAVIAALARGLGVPVSVVTEKYLISAGYEPPSSYTLAARRGKPENEE